MKVWNAGAWLLLCAIGTARAQTLDLGGQHGCAVTPENGIVCWGSDDVGQVGNDAGTDQSFPEPMPIDPTAIGSVTFTAVSAGDKHACGLTTGGDLFCWGGDIEGVLGNGESMQAEFPRPTPVVDMPQLVGFAKWTAVTAGALHTCGLDSLKRTWCWGFDFFGQLGNDELTTSKHAPVLVELPDGRHFVQVSAGAFHTCAVDDIGGAWCWGDDSSGKLGNGPGAFDAHVPMAVAGLPPLRSISAGFSHTCAVDIAGQAWCWGSNNNGELGDGSSAPAQSPLAVKAPAGSVAPVFASIAAGQRATCALDAARRAWCWGDDEFGELGDDAALANAATPRLVAAGLPPAVDQIALGNGFACAAGRFGAVACWGEGGEGQLAWGHLGNIATLSANGVTGAAQITAGGNHTCVLDALGAARCWGDNRFGQLGVGSTDAIFVAATPIAERAFTRISAGTRHTCAVDALGAAWCWGSNEFGQLGAANLIGSTTPVAVDISAVTALGRSIAQIDAGEAHTCAIDTGDTIWCWGKNDRGQLGRGTVSPFGATPEMVEAPGVDFLRVAVGGAHTCAIGTEGSIGDGAYCWGANESGQLFNGGKIDQLIIARSDQIITDPTLDRVDAGNAHTCFSLRGGSGLSGRRILCQGANAHFQSSEHADSLDASPEFSETVSAGTIGDGPVTGGEHTCVRSEGPSKLARCWGRNDSGQLGDNSFVDAKPPGGATDLVQALAAGTVHTCAIRFGGEVACTGDRSYGQLGDGKAGRSAVPVPIALVVNATGLFADGYETPPAP